MDVIFVEVLTCACVTAMNGKNKLMISSLGRQDDMSDIDYNMEHDIICKEVIISKLTTRGRGIVGDPVRRITQVFEKDGTLIAEYDPCANDNKN